MFSNCSIIGFTSIIMADMFLRVDLHFKKSVKEIKKKFFLEVIFKTVL